MKYTQQPVAVGGCPPTHNKHTHVCVAYTMMMIVCVLRLFKKREIPMSTDGDLHFRTHKRLFPFRRFLSDYTWKCLVPLFLFFIFCAWLYPKLHKKHSKTNTFLSLFSIWIKILVSLFFPHPPNSFFLFECVFYIAPRWFLMHLRCTYKLSLLIPSALSLCCCLYRAREREREDSRNALNEGPKLTTTLCAFFFCLLLLVVSKQSTMFAGAPERRLWRERERES